MSFLSSLALGPVTLNPALILAPMSGVTNVAFRRLIKELNPAAVGLVVTEFISVEGLTRRNEMSLRMMRYAEIERPISIQIFGHDVDRMVEAAKMVEDAGADIIDVNCGCPVPKVVRKGGGCELMRQPEHLAKILSGIRAAVKIPLTVKIRAGWDSKQKNAPEIARLAVDSGVSMIAVHGRTRQEMYRGLADWELVEQIASEQKVPIIGSGDIFDAPTAASRLSGNVSGLMIGRRALSNPWVFSEIKAYAEGREFQLPPATATCDVLERYIELLLEYVSEKSALGRLKQLASQITRRVSGSAEARRRLCTSPSVAEFRSELALWREQLESKPYAVISSGLEEAAVV